MQPINALSLAPDGNDWLANSHQPRILHVFEQACNLINEHREVLSVVTPEIGNGPFNLVIEEAISFSDHLNAQSPISIRADQIHFGELIINTEGAKLWSPHPDWERLHARRDDILRQIMPLRERWFSAQGNLIVNWEIASLQSSLLATTLPVTTYQSLTSSLAIADIPSSWTAARQLAGLGIGLTPAGDDFILGAVLAAWIIHPTEVVSVLAEKVTNIAAPLTTSLSAAYLKSAGKGEAGILWHNFFYALITNNSAAVELQITKLVSIGHTSGADALAGFIGTFTSYVEIEKNHVIPKYF